MTFLFAICQYSNQKNILFGPNVIIDILFGLDGDHGLLDLLPPGFQEITARLRNRSESSNSSSSDNSTKVTTTTIEKNSVNPINEAGYNELVCKNLFCIASKGISTSITVNFNLFNVKWLLV